MWGISSAGRALRWQRRGHRFDPVMLHQSISSIIKNNNADKSVLFNANNPYILQLF